MIPHPTLVEEPTLLFYIKNFDVYLLPRFQFVTQQEPEYDDILSYMVVLHLYAVSINLIKHLLYDVLYFSCSKFYFSHVFESFQDRKSVV